MQGLDNLVVDRIIPIEESFRAAQEAVLEEASGERIFFYKDARFRLATLHPAELSPVALYLLKSNLEFQRGLRGHLLNRYGIDTLQLSSVLHLKTAEGKIVGMTPPYVEISEERLGLIAREGDRLPPQEQILRVPLLIDGLHRAWLAMEEDIPITCIVARNTDSQYPYMAYPVDWSQVQIYDEVPKVKKHYRRQNTYTFMRPLESFRMTGPVTGKEYGR